MFIDALVFILLILAVIRGLGNGLIVSLITFIAYFLAIILALKFSALLAEWLQNQLHSTAIWIPFLAFLIIVFGVMTGMKYFGRGLEKLAKLASLGFVDKLGGFILFASIYAIILSIVVFYLREMKVISYQQISQSVTYPIIAPIGPWAIQKISILLPLLENVFQQISSFLRTATAF